MKPILYILIPFTFLFWTCDNGKLHDHDHQNSEEKDYDSDGFEEDRHHDIDSVYGIIEIKEQPFYEIIRTSGQILTAQGDEITLTAIHDGVVVFNEKQLLSGKKVSKGERLLTISGKELIHDNIEASYQDTKSEFDKAHTNYKRALELNSDKIISDRELLDIKLEYERLKNKYDLVKKNYSTGGQQLISTISGYVKNVLVTEGQYVVTGQPLLKLTKNKRLLVAQPQQ